MSNFAGVFVLAMLLLFPTSASAHRIDRAPTPELNPIGVEALAQVFHARMASIFDHLPADTPLVIEDPEAFLEEARRSGRGGERLRHRG